MNKSEAMEIAYTIPGQTWHSELGWLYETIKKSKAKKYVDVGTFCGRSLWVAATAISAHGEGGEVIAVDNFSEQSDPLWAAGVIGLTISMIKRRLPNVTPKLLRMSSLDAMQHPVVTETDFVFIDANHDYAECLADIEGWSSVALDEALICGHDYWPAHIGVMDAVNNFYKSEFSVIPGTRIWKAG